MKIGFEATRIFDERLTGVGHYAANLARQLALQSPGDEILLTRFGSGGAPAPGLDRKNISIHSIAMPRWLYAGLDHYLWAPPIDLLASIRPDVFVFPAFWAWPTRPETKTLVVIHDLAYLEVPETVPEGYRRRLSRQVPRSLERADAIIAVSESTKSQIISHYRVGAAKITVAPPGLDAEDFYPRPPAEVAGLRKRYRLPDRYVLFLGTLEPRKNIVGLLEAYEQYATATDRPVPLVLAGGDGWLNQEINDRLEQLIKKLPITHLGYLPEADRPAILSGAELFIFPSLYEGFGMPALEAMACGTPVITADNSSLPEAAGGAAILIKAEDSAELSRAVSRVLSSPSLAEKMSQRGIAHAKEFTWERTGRAALTAVQKTQK